jgi:Helix-turn-helix domain
MSNLKKNPPIRSTLLSPNFGPGQARTLQSANKDALDMLGQPVMTSDDPKGRVLRQLRVQSGMDPSDLATQACMSLSQLYELEEGGHSRFYSDSLRRQAGRRVARLLGADWDNIEQGQAVVDCVSSKVVPLQRPEPSAMSVTWPPHESAKLVAHDSCMPHPSGASVDDFPVSARHDGQAVSIGLAAPASETLLIQSPSAAYETKRAAPKQSSSALTNVFVLVLVAGAGVAGAFVLVEYSPYRLYWPW